MVCHVCYTMTRQQKSHPRLVAAVVHASEDLARYQLLLEPINRLW